MTNEPENPILAHLQAIRRDQAVMLEQIQRLARQIARLAETQVGVQQTIGDDNATLTGMRSDVIQLETDSGFTVEPPEDERWIKQTHEGEHS
jgi:hypothetical protein